MSLVEGIHELFNEIKHSVVVIKTNEKKSTPTSEASWPPIGEWARGVLISAEGRVVTTSHVVQTANEITIELLNGQKSSAYVLFSNTQADIALLQMKNIPLVSTLSELADSDNVKIEGGIRNHAS